MKRIHFVLLLFLLSGSLLLSGCSASDAPQLKVSVIDVKHGDCIVLQSPEGQTMMIDTGNGSYNAQSAIGDTLEQLNIQHLDSLILTHPDKDHIGGVSWVLENYDVTAVYTTARSKDTDLYRSVQTAIKQEGSTYLFYQRRPFSVRLCGCLRPFPL
ncbi:MAG: ComEC/Rec2 family competence protein [Christensenellales bacterium]